MTDIDVAALRAAAEAATVPMTCGGHQSMGLLIRCEECTGRMDARDDFDDAISPAVVLALLDRLEFLTSELGIAERASQRNANAHMAAIQRAHLAEGAVEEVRRAFDPGELDCGRIGMTCRDIHAPDRWCRACRITNALDPREQP